MGQSVVFEVSTQHAQAIAGFLQVSQAAEGVGRVGGDAGQKMKKAGDDAGESYGKMLGTLQSYPAAFAKMLTGASALYMAIGQINNEYERVVANRSKAMEGLDQTHEPYRRLTLQTSDEFQRSPKFKEMIKQSIMGRGDANNALSVAANAFSAAGALIEPGEVADAATLVNKLAGAEGMPQEDTEQLMTALILSMQVDRRRKKKTTAKEVLGTILSEFPLSTAVDMGKLKYQMQFENPLVEHAGFSREEAGALSSVLGQNMGDPDMRRTRTSGLLLEKSLKAAYQFASVYGSPYVDEKGREMSIDEFNTAGLKQIDIARSKTETGMMMRAYLAPKTKEEREMAFMIDPSGMHQGALQGEAGGKEVGEALLDPNKTLMEDVRKTMSHVKTGKAAEGLVDSRINLEKSNNQEKYFENQRKIKGAIQYAQFQNTTMAQQGSFNQLVEELGSITGTGDLQQKFRGISANLQSSGKTPAEIEELQRAAVQQSIQDMLYKTTPQTDPNFLDWAKKNRPDQHRGVWGTVFSRDSEPYPRSVFEEYRRETMPEDQRAIVGAFDTFLQTPAGGKPGRSSRGPRAAGAATSGSTDQAALLQAVGELTAALHGYSKNPLAVNVQVEDGLGRQLGRSTSRPRALEQFNDPDTD
jgi:hypothetical protein